VTIDYDTLKDETVTLRDRVTWKQVRAPIGSLVDRLRAYVEEFCPFSALGAPLPDSVASP
jgi:glycyl-tRNA synthetase